MVPRWKQRLGGAFIALVSGGMTAWMWHTAVAEGFYYPKASVIMPLFCVTGLAMMVFPGYREQRMARGEDITQFSGPALITPLWWAIMAAGLLAGFVNLFLLSGGAIVAALSEGGG